MNDKEKQIEICENCKIKDTCSNRILVHMEKCKVNDCDYYCEATDREKQIEEMAIEIAKRDCHLYTNCPKEPKHNCLSQEPAIMLESSKNYTTIAIWLYNAGYRNCKDKVVLTREEYDIIDHNIKHLENVCNAHEKTIEYWEQQTKVAREEIDNAVKETAREILHTIQSYDGWNELQRLRDEIAEKYEVEVE